MPSVPSATLLSPNHFPRQRLLIAAAIAIGLSACSKDPMVEGSEFMKKGDYPSAVIELKNAVQKNPSSLQARLALADALEHTYDTVGAEQHLRKALANGGDTDSLLLRIALLMLDRKESAKVINEFKDKKLSKPEADSDLRGVVAIAYLNQSQQALAQQQLSRAAAKTDATMLANAQFLLSQGNKEGALAAIVGAQGSKGSPWWVLRGLGRIQESAGNRDQAFGLMTRAYEAAPWHHAVMGEYAEFLLGVGKLEEAAVIRDRMKKLAPGFYWTDYVDALVLAQQGKTEASQAAALRVLRSSPDHLPANLLVASAELQKGDAQMANLRLQKRATDHPYSLPLLYLLIESQIRTGKYTEATEALRRGFSVAPKDARLLSMKADVEVARGKTKDAAATLEDLVAAHPDNPGNLLRLSQLYARGGNGSAAKGLLLRAATSGKNNPAIRDRIIGSFIAMGDFKDAQELAEYALKNLSQDPQSHLAMSAVHIAQKNRDGAWVELKKALDLKPTFQAALQTMEMVADTPAKKDELFARYGAAVEAKGAAEGAYLSYARRLREKSKSSESTAVLEKGIAVLPESVALRQALTQEYFRIGKNDAALSTAQSGAATNNAPPEASALLGETYERLGDIRLATETFRKLAANYPQRGDWRIKLAELEASSGNKKEATTILRSLITDRPLDPQAYTILATLVVSDNQQEALSIAHELGTKQAQKLTAMLLEGDLLVQSGNLDEGLKQYSKAGAAGAQPAAALRIVQLLDKTDRKSAADLEISEALRKYPQDASVIGFAAQRLRGQGKLDKAIAMLQQLADKNSRNFVVLNDLAWAQIEAKSADALKNASAAVALAPDNPIVLDTMGMAQAMSGDKPAAIATLRTASNLAPKASTPRVHLAELLVADGDKKGAADILRTVNANQLAPREKQSYARLKEATGQ